MSTHSSPPLHRSSSFQPILPVAAIVEDGFPPVPAIHHMINRARILNAYLACHEARSSQPGETCHYVGLPLYLEVFYATGIRKEELRNLTVGDLHFGDGLLRITHGKGAKDRVVPLGRMAMKSLEDYLTEGRPHLLGSKRSDRLFLSYRGQPLDSHTLGTLVREHAQAAVLVSSKTAQVQFVPSTLLTPKTIADLQGTNHFAPTTEC